MSKKTLNMMYNWIGPNGPISNTRIPNAVDITKNTFSLEINFPQGLDPIYNTINNFVDINLVTPKWLNENSEKFVYELEMLHTRVWDTNFKHGFGILENAFIPKNVYFAVREKIGYFLITTPMESFLDDYMLQQIHQYFTLHQIPLSQIIYLTNSINCKEIYHNFCERYENPERMNCEYIGTWVNLLVPNCQNSILQNPYVVGKKTKTFLKFNRRYREQRLLFLFEIYHRGILDDFYISFAKEEPENHITFVRHALEMRNRYNLNITDDDISKLNDKLPLVLDTDDLSVFPVETSLDQTYKFYEDSLIHIIAETNFFSDIIHLTEKTLKPIMYKQPFIILGPKKSLFYIKQLGFKTFEDIWDESYDLIEDNMERLYSVINLIESISKKSEEEKLEISKKVKDIVEYNFDQMKNRNPIEVYDFVDRYGV